MPFLAPVMDGDRHGKQHQDNDMISMEGRGPRHAKPYPARVGSKPECRHSNGKKARPFQLGDEGDTEVTAEVLESLQVAGTRSMGGPHQKIIIEVMEDAAAPANVYGNPVKRLYKLSKKGRGKSGPQKGAGGRCIPALPTCNAGAANLRAAQGRSRRCGGCRGKPLSSQTRSSPSCTQWPRLHPRRYTVLQTPLGECPN